MKIKNIKILIDYINENPIKYDFFNFIIDEKMSIYLSTIIPVLQFIINDKIINISQLIIIIFVFSALILRIIFSEKYFFIENLKKIKVILYYILITEDNYFKNSSLLLLRPISLKRMNKIKGKF